METVPYPDGAPDGGRVRGPKPLWAALLGGWRPQSLGPATTTFVVEQGVPEAVKWLGPDGLQPVPAGEVRVHWIQPEDPQAAAAFAVFREAVEESMQAVAAALKQEAEAKGFGQHVLKNGLHLIVTPEESFQAMSIPSDTIVVSAGTLQACFNLTPKDSGLDLPAAMAALLCVLAHEAAHLYLKHGEEDQLVSATLSGFFQRRQFIQRVPGLTSVARWLRCIPETDQPGAGFLQLASTLKELSWQHEYEADEVACALLARLRLSPEHMTAFMRVASASTLRKAQDCLEWLEGLQQELTPAQKQQHAAQWGWPGADFDAGVAGLKAAVEGSNADAIGTLNLGARTGIVLRELAALAEGSGGSADGPSRQGIVRVGRTCVTPTLVSGPHACPEPAIEAVLADLADTHPPNGCRIMHIQHLAAQLAMLQRATAPPVPVDGRYSHVSVAEQVAERLAGRLRAREAAEREAAAKKAAEEQAAAVGLGGAAGKGAAAAAVALAMAAAMGLLTVAVQ